jgi:RimJ/RimL family protein N-acetyltransferase
MAEVTLREVREEDLEALYEQQRDAESLHMADVPGRERDDFFTHWRHNVMGGPGVVRTIVYGDRVAGHVVSFRSGDEDLVGYWVARELWGLGIATAALRSLLEEVEKRPLRAHVAATNSGSIRVLEKCGFELVPGETLPPSVHEVEGLVLELSG